MGMFVVPIFVALGVAFLGWLQACSQQMSEEQLARDVAMQAYLDQMGQLLLNHNLDEKLQSDEVAQLARARTITVLGILAPDEKWRVVLFLYESGLIDKSQQFPPPVSMQGADLREVDLYVEGERFPDEREYDLSSIVLSKAYLDRADLRDAILSSANLSHADMSETRLGRV
jgi:hypothetical protein